MSLSTASTATAFAQFGSKCVIRRPGLARRVPRLGFLPLSVYCCGGSSSPILPRAKPSGANSGAMWRPADACDQPGGKSKHSRDPGPMGTDRFHEGDANDAGYRPTLVELQRPAEPAYVPTQGLPPGAAITGERATSP
jgi:hypothetical protein